MSRKTDRLLLGVEITLVGAIAMLAGAVTLGLVLAVAGVALFLAVLVIPGS